jgi:hypothetical protein
VCLARFQAIALPFLVVFGVPGDGRSRESGEEFGAKELYASMTGVQAELASFRHRYDSGLSETSERHCVIARVFTAHERSRRGVFLQGCDFRPESNNDSLCIISTFARRIAASALFRSSELL